MIRTLHVTNWYPSSENPYEALWIERQIQALHLFCDVYVLHIQVVHSKRLHWSGKRLPEGKQFILEIPFASWRLTELIFYCLLKFYILKLKVNRNFDLINFHIAYPLLTFWHRLKKHISIPVILTEHWSAYHFDFNVSNPEKLKRIKNIFHQKIPLLVVSKSLQRDINRFSGIENPESFVLPNVVNTFIFNRRVDEPQEQSFFMLSLWKHPKDPATAIRGFQRFLEKTGRTSIHLKIGGYGPLWGEMEKLVDNLNLSNHIIFLGKLNAEDIAKEMNRSTAFIHCSHYETFSVVCAEALCCGTPVIASAVGGITDLLTSENGILVATNTAEEWSTSFAQCMIQGMFDRMKISAEAQKKFSMESVGLRYYQIVKNTYDKSKNDSIPSYS